MEPALIFRFEFITILLIELANYTALWPHLLMRKWRVKTVVATKIFSVGCQIDVIGCCERLHPIRPRRMLAETLWHTTSPNYSRLGARGTRERWTSSCPWSTGSCAD